MELWDIYDITRNLTGRIHERGKPMANGDYHLVVNIWIINSLGQIFVSKRHPDKPFPNLWECTGGSVLKGETSLQGALREVQEEIGINLSVENGKFIFSKRRDNYHDFNDVWLFRQDIELSDVICQPEEVTAVKWVTRLELEQLYQSGQLVPTLGYFNDLFDKNMTI